MGVFWHLEKWFERGRAEPGYICANCEARFAVDRQQCPECSSGNIRRVEFT